MTEPLTREQLSALLVYYSPVSIGGVVACHCYERDERGDAPGFMAESTSDHKARSLASAIVRHLGLGGTDAD